jgi:lipopolysaccharide transport system ATP-binding protein
VGDAEFQQKCLGRMSDVASQGRTVLFVSHNIAAMQRLCSLGLHLQQGHASGIETIQAAASHYLEHSVRSKRSVDLSSMPRRGDFGGMARMVGFEFVQDLVYGRSWEMWVMLECSEAIRNGIISVAFDTLDGSRVLTLDSDCNGAGLLLRKGGNRVRLALDFVPLHPAPYSVGGSVWCGNQPLDGIACAAIWEVGAGDAIQFEVRGFGGARPALQIVMEEG